ncbi:MAG: type II toxin-antitoxin system VapC family toxin [Myxococcaceae bacterium]
MILVDTNILLYATIPEYPEHPAAYQWLLQQLRNNSRIGLPWASLMGFVRITINPKIYKNPVPLKDALKQVSDWLSLDNVWVPEPTAQHIEVLTSILDMSTKDSNLIPDAHLAALAVEHGLTVYSADHDFAKFKRIKWVNPITDLRH